MGGNFVRTAVLVGIASCTMIAERSQAQSTVVDARSEGVARAMMVTVNVENVKLEQVLRMIARQAGLRLFVPGGGELQTKVVSMHVRDMLANDAFTKALTGTGLRASISAGDVILTTLGAGAPSMAQGGITGKVVDATTKQPLRGATIVLDDAGKGVSTRDDGTFRISNVTPGSHVVLVRMLGYTKTKTMVTVTEGQSATVDVSLEPSVSALDQVVVTGTIVATELKAVPSAITVITAKEIEARGITRIDQLFRGDVPGLFAQNGGSGNALDAVTMFSRGATTVSSYSAGTANGTNPIKTYVDGIELANPAYLSQIDPRSIERIEILTGPQASTIYGSNALNGVMQIFTKRATRARPQLTLNAALGEIQNNFSSALTPVHTYDGRVSGQEGRLSYNVGGAWDYTGAWSPAKQTQRTSVDGGARFQAGAWTADGNARYGVTKNLQRGNSTQVRSHRTETGELNPSGTIALSTPVTYTLNGQTVGLTIGYATTPWWSHELVVGADESNNGDIWTAFGYFDPSDTLLMTQQNMSSRTSQRYTTTAHLPLTSQANVTVTVGGDHTRSVSSSVSGWGTILTGTLSNPYVTRDVPQKNTGAFVQGQLGIRDALFFTYGLRAEWNPNYGDDAQPNLAPRYGIAYTRDMGSLTAKIRASYGRSTRPPENGLRIGVPNTDPQYAAIFGQFDAQVANPNLGPEYQQGGEGGIELYWGNRGSLVVTRYNQTVDALISSVYPIDSVQSLRQYDAGCASVYSPVLDNGYCYYVQSQFLNVAGIRNQGWELQGSLTTGPITTRGTYSWTKSRVMGVTPEYRAQFGTQANYQPGATFDFLPEHTWALNVAYARAATTLTLSVNGTGFLYRQWDALADVVSGGTRLDINRPRTTLRMYRYLGPGYTMADLNGTRRLSSMVDAILQVQNLTNFYQNDVNVETAAIGRQTKVGVRVRM